MHIMQVNILVRVQCSFATILWLVESVQNYG